MIDQYKECKIFTIAALMDNSYISDGVVARGRRESLVLSTDAVKNYRSGKFRKSEIY